MLAEDDKKICQASKIDIATILANIADQVKVRMASSNGGGPKLVNIYATPTQTSRAGCNSLKIVYCDSSINQISLAWFS